MSGITEHRGFLFRDQHGAYYLESEPHLKTCCVGKKESSILLEGSFPKKYINRAISVRGTLNEQRLEDATLIQESSAHWNLWILGILILTISRILMRKRA